MYIGGGIFFAIILGLILLPLFGIGLWFPFTSADASGTVNYRSTETLNYNEYWYEYEYVDVNSDITFSVQSSPSHITFAIFNQPFEELGTIDEDGYYPDSISLQYNQYEYYWLFLRPDSSIYYNFTANNPVDFFIADAYQLYDWNQEGNPSFYEEVLNSTGAEGSLSIYQSNDYYLVWYNDVGGTINVDFTVNYTAANVIDFSNAYAVNEAVYTASGTFSVPNPGNWYFFVYFDPFNSPEESTTITFDVTYDTGITYTERWLDIQWILIFILVVIVIIIIIAFAARKGQKKMSLKAKKEQKAEPTKAVKEEVKIETKKCPRCSFDIKPDANFCPKCGGKIEGRSIGSSEITTPAEAKTCSFCGSKLSETSNFCPWCGTPKLKNDQSTIKKI